MNRGLYLSLLIGSIIFSVFLSFGCSRQIAKDYSSADSTKADSELAPVQINSVSPVYPPEALSAGITGTVWLKVLIDTNGVVTNSEIVRDSGKNAGFEEASLDAALKTTWKPAMSDGEPIEVWVTYKIEFNIR